MGKDSNEDPKHTEKRSRAAAERAKREAARRTAVSAALASLGDDARAVLQGDDGSSIIGISMRLREDGCWRITITDSSEGYNRVAFSVLDSPAQLWDRLPEIVARADWTESKF